MALYIAMTLVKIPLTEYNRPAKYNVTGRNLYLNTSDDVTLGFWHVFPKSLHNQLDANLTEERVQRMVRDHEGAIVIYLHGNSFDRTTLHRCELYRLLSAMNMHVLAVDYRGYGDSTGRPTEDGVVTDAKAIYNYAKKLDPAKPIIVYGHSMGTGVAARAVAELCDAGIQPKALVLGKYLRE